MNVFACETFGERSAGLSNAQSLHFSPVYREWKGSPNASSERWAERARMRELSLLEDCRCCERAGCVT